MSSLPDRKSTRLNSSHLGISYAVFCLKKKINTISRDASQHSHPWASRSRPRSITRLSRHVALGSPWVKGAGCATVLRPFFFFFNDPAPPEISTLSLPDALPISHADLATNGRPVGEPNSSAKTRHAVCG